MLDTPQDYYEHFITEEKKITAQYAEKNPFFKKVVDSQTEFARMVFPYRLVTMNAQCVGGKRHDVAIH